MFKRSHGCGGGGCKLFGKLHGGCGGGCYDIGWGGGGYDVGYGGGQQIFTQSVGDCGSCGAYFNEAVGPEYGTAGMQSVVSGCATGACGGGYDMGYNSAPVNYESSGMNSVAEPIYDGGMQGTPMYGGGMQGTPMYGGGIQGTPIYGDGMQGTPVQSGSMQAGDYMGTVDPTANAKEIPGEAVSDAAEGAIDKLQDAVDAMSK